MGRGRWTSCRVCAGSSRLHLAIKTSCGQDWLLKPALCPGLAVPPSPRAGTLAQIGDLDPSGPSTKESGMLERGERAVTGLGNRSLGESLPSTQMRQWDPLGKREGQREEHRQVRRGSSFQLFSELDLFSPKKSRALPYFPTPGDRDGMGWQPRWPRSPPLLP